MRAISPPWATLGQWQMEIMADDDFEKTFFKNTQMIPFSFLQMLLYLQIRFARHCRRFFSLAHGLRRYLA